MVENLSCSLPPNVLKFQSNFTGDTSRELIHETLATDAAQCAACLRGSRSADELYQGRRRAWHDADGRELPDQASGRPCRGAAVSAPPTADFLDRGRRAAAAEGGARLFH